MATCRTHRHTGIFGLLRRYRRDRKGVAAVEFALIVPLLLLLYLGTMEVSSGVALNKRVARAASTTADLIAQQEDVTRTQLNAIMEVSQSILFPYTADQPRVTVVGIHVDEDYPLGGKVRWSRRMNKDGSFNTPLPFDEDIQIPARLLLDDTFIIMASVEVTYLPLIAWVTDRNPDGSAAGIDMRERYWLHPRLVDEITCADC